MAQMCIKIITFFIISYFSICASVEGISKFSTNCTQTPNATTTFATSNPGVKDALFTLNSEGRYDGMEADINVWTPKVASELDISSVSMWIQAGDFPNIDIAGAGWMVAPNFYHDHQPRFTTFWTRDNFQRTGCFNTECEGFKLVGRPGANLGAPLNSSTFNETQPQQSIHLSIYRNFSTGDWELSYNGTSVGHWPRGLFTPSGLGFGVATMAWGGKVFNGGEFWGQTRTEMGSGHFPDEGFKKACYIKNITVFNIDDNVAHSPAFEDLQPQISNPNCYDAKKHSVGNFGTHMFLGGNGANNPNCK